MLPLSPIRMAPLHFASSAITSEIGPNATSLREAPADKSPEAKRSLKCFWYSLMAVSALIPAMAGLEIASKGMPGPEPREYMKKLAKETTRSVSLLPTETALNPEEVKATFQHQKTVNMGPSEFSEWLQSETRLAPQDVQATLALLDQFAEKAVNGNRADRASVVSAWADSLLPRYTHSENAKVLKEEMLIRLEGIESESVSGLVAILLAGFLCIGVGGMGIAGKIPEDSFSLSETVGRLKNRLVPKSFLGTQKETH